MGKARVFVYGTCQSGAVVKFLKESDAFNEGYEVIGQVLSYEMIDNGVFFADDPAYKERLASADVFLFQPVCDLYGKNSTNHIRSLLRSDCRQISFPYVYNTATWPVVPALKRDFSEEWMKGVGEKWVLIGAETIDELVNKNLNLSQILTLYDNLGIDFRFDQRLTAAWDITAEKEKNLDIKVENFIKENLQKKRLFMYCSHPTWHLFLYLTNEVLKLLGCDMIVMEFPLDFCEISTCGFPMAYPIFSYAHFKFEFPPEASQSLSNKFFRDHIMSHLHRKGMR